MSFVETHLGKDWTVRCRKEVGYWNVFCDQIPGVVCDGVTLQKALDNLKETIADCITKRKIHEQIET